MQKAKKEGVLAIDAESQKGSLSRLETTVLVKTMKRECIGQLAIQGMNQ